MCMIEYDRLAGNWSCSRCTEQLCTMHRTTSAKARVRPTGLHVHRLTRARKPAYTPRVKGQTDATDSTQSVVQPDSRLGLSLAAVAAVLYTAGGNDLIVPVSVHGLLGFFLLIQSRRIRFRVDGERIEVLQASNNKTSEFNVLQAGGGASSWRSNTVTNWEVWFPGFPLLCYFRCALSVHKWGGSLHPCTCIVCCMTRAQLMHSFVPV